MNVLALSPLARSSFEIERPSDVFDSFFDRVWEDRRTYPAHDLIRLDENRFELVLAVPGFSEEDLDIEANDVELTITGNVPPKSVEDDGEFIQRHIDIRAFERRFQLGEHVKISDAKLNNGLLRITIEREIPESAKRKKIEIKS